MIFVNRPNLTALINQYQNKDYTLWQILNALANSSLSLIDQFNNLRTAVNWMLRLELPTVATGGDKCLAAHRVTLPRDENGNLIYTKILPVMVHITSKTAPSGADFIGDLRYSRNQNDFYSIFKTTTTLVLPQAAVFAQYGEFSTNLFIDAGLMVLDVTQTGSCIGVEVTILGIMLP